MGLPGRVGGSLAVAEEFDVEIAYLGAPDEAIHLPLSGK
jgi:hypothetical protein